jgi:hypothetical protein
MTKKKVKTVEPWKTFRIARMTIGPNDMLVLRTELLLDKYQLTALRDSLLNMLPDDLKPRCIVLACGLQLAVLHKNEGQSEE